MGEDFCVICRRTLGWHCLDAIARQDEQARAARVARPLLAGDGQTQTLYGLPIVLDPDFEAST